MNPSRDPFGFPAKSRVAQSTRPIQGPGTGPIVVVALPGQEVRILVGDGGGGGGGLRGDSSVSPGGKGDSSVSPGGKGDSSVSPGGKGDLSSQDAFGFRTFQPGFSPTPVTIIARSGQEIRIVVPDQSGSVPGLIQRFSGDSSVSPGPKGDE
jgi:hypothetical protein